LLQPAQGRPQGGGHSFSSGHHFSGSNGRYGHYYGGPRYYSGGARYYRSSPRFSSQGALQNRAYYSNSAVNRTAALNPRAYSASGQRLATARRTSLRSQGFDSQGRVLASSSRTWDRTRDHNWNGHRCHWHNNAWVIIDPWFWDGYPWGYGYYGPYSYYEPEYYEDAYEPAGYSQSDNDNGVRNVQSALARKGYYHGAIDGRMGPETRSAVRQYQRNHGFEVTGNIDRGVTEALRLR
jgi:hypothetical protein